MKKVFQFSLILVLSSYAVNLKACRCNFAGSIGAEVAFHQAVFVGKVLRQYQEKNKSGYTTVLIVKKAFKGVQQGDTLHIYGGSGDCEYIFQKRKGQYDGEYPKVHLVYAQKTDSGYLTHLCTRSVGKGQRKKDEYSYCKQLKFLRRYQRKATPHQNKKLLKN